MRTSWTAVFFVLALALLGSALISTPAFPGRHEGGVLILHADPDIVYTAGLDGCSLFSLDACGVASVELPTSDIPQVWFVVAAFPERSSPRLVGVSFGVDWDPSVLTLTSFGRCGDFELTSDGWPDPDTGTAMTWDAPNTELLTPVYWFAGYEYAGSPTSFRVVPGPYDGAFVDDSVPGILDPVAAYGELGFSGAPGDLPCPDPGEPGACCLSECECIVVTESACLELGGSWSAGVDCSLDLCGCPPSACCLPSGECQVLAEADCLAEEGLFLPEELCDPYPCPDPPTGACCLFDGTCVEVTVMECEALDGLFSDRPCSQVECQEPCDPVLVPGPELTGGGEGPNVDGVLIVHVDPNLTYTEGLSDYCGLTGLVSCEEATIEVDPQDAVIVSIFAAFPESTLPSVDSVDFGIFYPTCITVVEGRGCGQDFVPYGDWPASGSSTLVLFAETQTERLFEVAWMAAYVDEGYSGQLALGPGRYGGLFYECCSPNGTNPIVDFGRIGFRTDGYLPCPVDAVAACCFDDGACQILTLEECDSGGGTFVPESPDCDPNPCVTVPTIETSWGRIKETFR